MADPQQDDGAAVETTTTARGEARRVYLSKARRALARRFAESRATIPQLEVAETVELSRLRSSEQDLLAGVVAACGQALADHPRLNAGWRDAEIEEYSRRNVAVAVPTADGIALPTIFDADRKDPGEIADEVAELGCAALEGTLRAPQTAGATFTVQPPAGARELSASVAGGQAAVLALGEPRPTILPVRGGPALVEAVELRLSCDGRVVLAAEAGAFIAEIRARLEGRDRD